MANLIIDIGNTAYKITYANGTSLGRIHRYHGDSICSYIDDIIEKKHPEITIVSSVRESEADLIDLLEKRSERLIILNSSTELPIKNLYKTPHTLGPDRIASMVAANKLFPEQNCIVFDFGTAMTVDFINKEGEYLGGNISLGLRTRFKAINHYTKKLPLLENPINTTDIGDSTDHAIENGVVLGIMFEVMGYIEKYNDHVIIFTGGDAVYFAEQIKHPIFVVNNLVLTGLAQIADYYANV